MAWTKPELIQKDYTEILIQEKKVTKPQLLKRLQCLKLKQLGWSNYQIALFLLVNHQTISNWLGTYRRHGLNGLMDWKYKKPKRNKKALSVIERA